LIAFAQKLSRHLIQEDANRADQVKMKLLLATIVGISVIVEGLSLTCYRCGGGAPAGDCRTAGSATVQCESSSLPNEVYGCQVYTVNYTTLNNVLEFKSCCFYKDCEKNPCEKLANTVCSKMASCQSDKCNFNYTTAKASQRPTLPPTAGCKVLLGSLGIVLAMVVVLYLSI